MADAEDIRPFVYTNMSEIGFTDDLDQEHVRAVLRRVEAPEGLSDEHTKWVHDTIVAGLLATIEYSNDHLVRGLNFLREPMERTFREIERV